MSLSRTREESSESGHSSSGVPGAPHPAPSAATELVWIKPDLEQEDTAFTEVKTEPDQDQDQDQVSAAQQDYSQTGVQVVKVSDEEVKPDPELIIKQEPEETEYSEFPFSVVSVKSEEDEAEERLSEQGELSESDQETEHPSSESDDWSWNRERLSNGSTKEMQHEGEDALSQTKTRPYSCPVCNKEFSHKSSLSRHKKFHKEEKPNEPYTPYSCPFCSKRFSFEGNLKRHVRTHTGERPFSCSVCERHFTLNSHLKAHMATHTGERPFSCSVCQARFKQKQSLGRHMTVHTGERPFSCSVCNKSFSQKSSVKTHMKTHSRGTKEEEETGETQGNLTVDQDQDQDQDQGRPEQGGRFWPGLYSATYMSQVL